MFDFIKKYKAWIVGTTLIICIALFYSGQGKEQSVRTIEAQKLYSISDIPTGVEEKWMLYLEKRFSEEIQRESNSLRIRESYMGASPTYSYVSLNHSYEIDCNSFHMGFSVFFPSGVEEGISVSLTGDFSSDHENEPERGVPVGSIASDNLDSTLCKHLSLLMEDIVSRNSR